MIFLYIALALLAIEGAWAFLYIAHYNLHMFQLNGYKRGEHLSWLKKNSGRQRLLLVPALLCAAGTGMGITRAGSITAMIVTGAAADLFMAPLILYYSFLKSRNVKKKLVFTARCVRLYVTIALLTLLPAAAMAFFSREAAVFLFVFLVSVNPVLLLSAACINSPIEQAVSGWYINDAKRMLKERPDLKIIGVTGSYGKTSVKYYLEALLSVRYEVLITPGSFNTPMGVVRTIRERLKRTHQIFVCEMGARHVGDIKEICDIVHPEDAVITAIGPQHLETFFNMDNIVSTKFELADSVRGRGRIFLNMDNELIAAKAASYEGVTGYSCLAPETEAEGRERGRAAEGEGAAPASASAGRAAYTASEIVTSSEGTAFKVKSPDGQEEVFSTRLVGSYNVINILGAITVAASCGIPLKELTVPVRRLSGVEHRMQLKRTAGATIIDDAYNSNPVGSKAAVETLGLFDGVKILITPGMVELGDKQYEYNRLFGGCAAESVDYILTVGQVNEKAIHEGAREKNFSESAYRNFEEVGEALKFAYSIPDEGKERFILLENDLTDNYM